MIRLKICGMKYHQNIEEVASLRPDYLGFIFYENSPRNFLSHIPALDSAVKKTGVFVNPSLAELQSNLKIHSLDTVQLHGEEDPSFCQAVKAEGVEVIKVFSVDEKFDFRRLLPYEGKVDFFLFDTLGKTKGGTGKSFNWDLLREYPSSTPFFLSGGIGEEELGKIALFHDQLKSRGKEHLLYAVDVNSRFESEPGQKISAKLKKFQEELKEIDH